MNFETIAALRSESLLYCSILCKMGEDLPFFNNNEYWVICSLIRGHKNYCESVHSAIFGVDKFCDGTDAVFTRSSLIVIRGLYNQAIVSHGIFLRQIIPYIKS